MIPKERFLKAIKYKSPDIPPLDFYYTEVGFYEHGEKLLRLYEKYPGDTKPVPTHEMLELAMPDPKHILPDGSYHKLEKDDWGTTWEYRIYGRMGQPKVYPLDDLEKLSTYVFPPTPLSIPDYKESLQKYIENEGQTYPVIHNIPGLFFVLLGLCPMENILIDLACENLLLEKLADLLTDRFVQETEWALEAGVDGISICDDFGTQKSLFISRDMWQKFFMPRLKRVIDPVKKAGKLCCFHSCGQVWDLLDDFKEVGIDSIWPQLPLYDYNKLAKKLRDLEIALCIHIDRGNLMPNGTPEQVKAEVKRVYETFRPDLGGSWFYFEVDQGFPFENVVALADAIDTYRR